MALLSSVSCSSAHTVGSCHLDRSGFDGQWTEDKLKFDNTYFTEMLAKKDSYTLGASAKGCPQHEHESGTIMLISDLALLEDPARQPPPLKMVIDFTLGAHDTFCAQQRRAGARGAREVHLAGRDPPRLSGIRASFRLPTRATAAVS